MAGRPRLNPGELGSISYGDHPKGVRGRARVRDAGGTQRRISEVAATREEVAEALGRQAAFLAHRTFKDNDEVLMGELLDEWVERTRRVKRPQTARTYAATVKWLRKECGGLAVQSFDMHQAKRLLRKIRKDRSAAAVRQAKVALNGAFARAIDRDLVTANPIRDLKEEEPDEKAPTFLTQGQLKVLRTAVKERETRTRPNAGKSAGILRWGMEVCLGSGLRIGEVLALRHSDVDLQTGVVEVRGTLIDGVSWENTRQTELKALGQARRVRLPSFAVAALAESREAAVRKEFTAPAIQSRAGTWVGPRNFRRQLRDVREDPMVVRALELTDLAPTDLTPHIFRRTASTLLARDQGHLRGASSLLGHTDVNTTRKHYVGIAWSLVDESDALQALFGGEE